MATETLLGKLLQEPTFRDFTVRPTPRTPGTADSTPPRPSSVDKTAALADRSGGRLSVNGQPYGSGVEVIAKLTR